MANICSKIVNIMDTIMFEAQRHGRLSFYMVNTFLLCWSRIILTELQVSADEEGITVGSAAALGPDDVIHASIVRPGCSCSVVSHSRTS